MAGFQFTVDLPAKTVAQESRATAQSSGFRIDEDDLFNFRLKKGHFPLSLFAGACIAYCDFSVELDEEDNGDTTMVMRRNTPWWTGLIGVARVQSAAEKLLAEIKKDLRELGGTIRIEKDIK